MSLLFLTLDEVLALHDVQVRLFGGSGGTRDLGLLESAIGNAEATFDGQFLHGTPFEIAAASALTFLEMNGISIEAAEDDFYDLVIGVAEGRVSKAAVAVFFEQHA